MASPALCDEAAGADGEAETAGAAEEVEEELDGVAEEGSGWSK